VPQAADRHPTGRHSRWHVRRRGRALGVFPAGAIDDFLLLGRLDGDDEASDDGVHWQRLRELPEFRAVLRDPQQHTEDALGKAWHDERIQAARRWADERSGTDRRSATVPTPEQIEQRSGGDRRTGRERLLHVYWRKVRARLGEPDGAVQTRRWWIAPALLVIAVGLAIGLMQPRAPRVLIGSVPADCGARPAPRVNLAGCDLRQAQLAAAALASAKLSGARLAGADLRGADLGYADLEGADLAGANLSGARLFAARLSGANLAAAEFGQADLRYADLRRTSIDLRKLREARLGAALWSDGRRCAPASVGRCD
jgi:hypothetical protein